jgi:hypothetical protein
MASQWSGWQWNDASGYWFTSRLNSQGQLEYQYADPTPTPETPRTVNTAYRGGVSQNVRNMTPISVAADTSSPVPSASNYTTRAALYGSDIVTGINQMSVQEPRHMYDDYNTGYDYKREVNSLSHSQYNNYAGTNTSAPKLISQPSWVSSPNTEVLTSGMLT